MDTFTPAIIIGVRTVLHLFLIATLAIGCVRFLTGCTLIEKANSDGKIVEVLKETYANGNAPQKTLAFSEGGSRSDGEAARKGQRAAAVSNKIEQLVTENAP